MNSPSLKQRAAILSLNQARDRNERELSPLRDAATAARAAVQDARTAEQLRTARESLGHAEHRLRLEQEAADGRLECAEKGAIDAGVLID